MYLRARVSGTELVHENEDQGYQGSGRMNHKPAVTKVKNKYRDLCVFCLASKNTSQRCPLRPPHGAEPLTAQLMKFQILQLINI